MDTAGVFGSAMVHRLTLYVPSTANVNEPLSESAAQEIINRSQRLMASLFGGATAIPAFGGWLSQTDELVRERITLVYSFTDELTTDRLMKFKRFAIELKAELGQEAIAVEIDGSLYFV